MSEARVECLWFGDCPICGPEGELVAVVIEPSSRVILKCLECALMYQTPDSLSSAQNLRLTSRVGERMRPATCDDIALLDWKAEARDIITASQEEIEYFWAETK